MEGVSPINCQTLLLTQAGRYFIDGCGVACKVCILTSLQLVVPRHTLDISMKYSYVPQTDNTPYKLDRTSPEIDWTVSEPEKVM